VVDLALRSLLFGGADDDDLIGAAGDDILFGGYGDDTLPGAAGNDLLVGGSGADRLVGSAGHDILIAGSLSGGLTIAAIEEILAEWVGVRQPDNNTESSITDDSYIQSAADRLTGGSGDDWFIVSEDDKITDLKAQGDHMTIVS